MTPADGRYRYTAISERVDAASGDVVEQQQTSVTVTTVSETLPDGRVVQIQQTQYAQAQPYIERRVWAADGVWVEFQRGLDGLQECLWTPSRLDFPAVMEQGRTWSSSSSCDIVPIVDEAFEVSRTESAKVVGEDVVEVGSATLRVWVVERAVQVQRWGEAVASTSVEHVAQEGGFLVWREETFAGSPSGGGQLASRPETVETFTTQLDEILG